MYAAIRRYHTVSGKTAQVMEVARQGFLPIISKAPGFVSYYIVDAGDDVIASISVFQDQAGAEESNRMAADFVRENVAALMAGPPEITAGTVGAHKTS